MMNVEGSRYQRDVGRSGVRSTNPELGKSFQGPAALPPEEVQRNVQDPRFPDIKGSVLTEAQLRLGFSNL